MYIWPHHQKEGLQLKHMKPSTVCGGEASFIGDRLWDFSHGGWQAGNAKRWADTVAPCVEGLRIGPRIRRPPGVRLRDGERGLLLRYHVRTGSGLAQVSYAIITRNSPPEWQTDHHLPFSASHAFPHIGYLHDVLGSNGTVQSPYPTARSRLTNKSAQIYGIIADFCTFLVRNQKHAIHVKRENFDAL
jgi:hypothetical protein